VELLPRTMGAVGTRWRPRHAHQSQKIWRVRNCRPVS